MVCERRKPGEAWTLWCLTDRKGPMGYLVTTRNRTGEGPRPVAFIEGIGGRSLRLAVLIRKDHGKAGLGTIDLRGQKLPPANLCGRILWPVDSLGRIITTDHTFGSGTFFQPCGYAGPKGGFMLWTQGAHKNGVQAGSSTRTFRRDVSGAKLVNAA